jgi:hypothetical protein
VLLLFVGGGDEGAQRETPEPTRLHAESAGAIAIVKPMHARGCQLTAAVDDLDVDGVIIARRVTK